MTQCQRRVLQGLNARLWVIIGRTSDVGRKDIHVPEEWFRSADWSVAAQHDFEKRLGRARGHNRGQYLRIKGLALRDAGHDAGARDLWLRILDGGDAYKSDQAATKEHLGDLFAKSDPDQAEMYYRRLLREHPTLNATTHTVEISLAELLLAKGDRQGVEEAIDHLRSWIDRRIGQLPDTLFRWNLVLIEAAAIVGDEETVRRSARTALNLAKRGPVFARHQDVGVVKTNSRTLRRLRRLAV